MEFDVVLGIDSASFSAGVVQLNGDPKAHDTFFKGECHDDNARGTWEVVDGPAFRFEPPTQQKWSESIDARGKHPDGAPPTADVFLLSIPSLRLTITVDGAPLPEVSPAVEFYAQVTFEAGAVSLLPKYGLNSVTTNVLVTVTALSPRSGPIGQESACSGRTFLPSSSVRSVSTVGR